MDFRLSPKSLNLLEEDEFDWTPPESKKLLTFHIFTPSTKTSKIKLENFGIPKIKNDEGMFFQDFLFSEVLRITYGFT